MKGKIDFNHCPVCGSDEIDSFDYETCYDIDKGGDMFIEHYSCSDCGSTWDIEYVVDKIRNIKDGRKHA